MYHRLLDTVRSLASPHITVLGDVMLDRYVWGRVERISPEAPIPVLHVSKREEKPGGAGNVANMLVNLGARVLCAGTVGQDENGQAVRRLLSEANVDCRLILPVSDRETTLKMRVLGSVQSAGRGTQQIVRIDEESTADVAEPVRARILAGLAEVIPTTDVVLLQDMGKGLISNAMIRALVDLAAKSGKPVIVDPTRQRDIHEYRGVTGIIPNRKETVTATGECLDCPESLDRAADKLLSALASRFVVIKLDRDGIYFKSVDGQKHHVPTEARQVADVTGAGDMVASVIAMVYASGAGLDDAITLANIAAGLEISRIGASAVSLAELSDEIRARTDPAARKVKRMEELLPILDEHRRHGNKIVFTNGCFDLLHVGHIELIKFARQQGDLLVLGINTDRSVQELKGPTRPINTEAVRARLLAAMEDVDYVVSFDEVSVEPLIRKLRPDVLVKGSQYSVEGVVGHEFVMSYGGQIRLAPHLTGYSTTDIIKKIEENPK